MRASALVHVILVLAFAPRVAPCGAADSVNVDRSSLVSMESDSGFVFRAVRLSLGPHARPAAEPPLSILLRSGGAARSMYGYETYRATRIECMLTGAGAGATLGLAAGALGSMSGAWEDDTAWLIGAAMAAVGAFYGGAVKADDPGWNLRIRWDPDRGRAR